jgi:hypothetical protein
LRDLTTFGGTFLMVRVAMVAPRLHNASTRTRRRTSGWNRPAFGRRRASVTSSGARAVMIFAAVLRRPHGEEM